MVEAVLGSVRISPNVSSWRLNLAAGSGVLRSPSFCCLQAIYLYVGLLIIAYEATGQVEPVFTQVLCRFV